MCSLGNHLSLRLIASALDSNRAIWYCESMLVEGNVKERKAMAVRIPAEMHKRIRHLAIEENTTVNDLVVQLFRERLAKAKKGAA